jgi:hypothetical protein
MGKIKTKKTKEAALRSRSKWLQVGDRCSKEFFRAVRPINAQATISEFKDKRGRFFTKREDLERITKDFYEELYAHKDVSEEALARVMEGVPATFINSMNDALDKEITERELRRAVNSMAKGKAPGHDGVAHLSKGMPETPRAQGGPRSDTRDLWRQW